MDQEDDILTAEEVAEWLEVPVGWIFTLVAANDIPYVRPRRRWRTADYRFQRGEVEEWLRRDGERLRSREGADELGENG